MLVPGLAHDTSISLSPAIFFLLSSSPESTALTYPVSLKAVLAAEVGFLAQLLACGTLQAAGVVVAVAALALALVVDRHLFCWCLVHDECLLDPICSWFVRCEDRLQAKASAEGTWKELLCILCSRVSLGSIRNSVICHAWQYRFTCHA